MSFCLVLNARETQDLPPIAISLKDMVIILTDYSEKLSCAWEEIKYENETTQLLVRVIISAVILGLYEALQSLQWRSLFWSSLSAVP